jgi:DNA-binding transcriptional ArsR family regulator
MRNIKHPLIEHIELADIMYAFSDSTRIDIVRQLGESSRPMTCGELGLGRPKSSMSHHFKILREAGIIETTVEGKGHFNLLRLKELNIKFPNLLNTLLENIKDRRV